MMEEIRSISATRFCSTRFSRTRVIRSKARFRVKSEVFPLQRLFQSVKGAPLHGPDCRPRYHGRSSYNALLGIIRHNLLQQIQTALALHLQVSQNKIKLPLAQQGQCLRHA